MAESIGLKGGKISVTALCTLHSPYKIPGLLPVVLIFLYWLYSYIITESPLSAFCITKLQLLDRFFNASNSLLERCCGTFSL